MSMQPDTMKLPQAPELEKLKRNKCELFETDVSGAEHAKIGNY